MKTLNYLKVLSTVVASVLIVFVSSTGALGKEKKAPTIEDHLQEIVSGYIQVHADLANSTVEHVEKSAGEIMKSVDATIELAEKDKKKNEKLIKTLGNVRISAKTFAKKGIKLKEARDGFYALSDNVIELVKNHLPEKAAAEYRVFYCPMAKGYWLQTDKKTRNPYYGKGNMLMCGQSIDWAKECAECEGNCTCEKQSGKCGCPFKGSEKGKNEHSERMDNMTNTH